MAKKTTASIQILNKCSVRPYGRTPKTKQSPVVSWDGLLETGWEPDANIKLLYSSRRN